MLRADQVGSLLRPPELLAAREAAARGSLSREALREQEDAAILRALEGQRNVGLEIFTDGEFRRGSWITDMAEAVDGFVPRSRTIEWRGPGGGPEPSTSRVVGARLQQRRRLTGQESAFLRQYASGVGGLKMTLPAPSNFYVVSWQSGVSEAAYASRSEMLAEIVRIVRAEIEALIAEGITYIQMDAPFYGAFIDQGMREQLRADGLDPDRGLQEAVAGDNAAIEGLASEGLTLALHICRGNSRSRWLYEGGYDPLAEALFGGLGVDTFLLEYDSPRDGSFEPLRFVPADKRVVLGLISTKQATLESPDDLRRRVDEAARCVPLERLALSPQCGFASVAAGNLLSEADQWRKLELTVETARAIWFS
jgi:5-methyltetrahydropteroyltriglutamate--homocysteine methyltransferase